MDFVGAKTNRHLFRAGAPPRLAGRSAERSEVRVQSSGSGHVLRTADKRGAGFKIRDFWLHGFHGVRALGSGRVPDL